MNTVKLRGGIEVSEEDLIIFSLTQSMTFAVRMLSDFSEMTSDQIAKDIAELVSMKMKDLSSQEIAEMASAIKFVQVAALRKHAR